MKIDSARKNGMFQIAAYDEAGNTYILNRRFRKDDPLLNKTLAAIRAKGEINLQHWKRK